MDNNPKLSVVMPVYQAQQYLMRAVDSVLNQSRMDLELILVDDGSTDNSGKICEQCRERDGRVIVIHTVNQGAAAARNEGIARATGEYLEFIDSDDYLDENAFLTIMEEIENSASELVVYGVVFEYYDAGIKKREEIKTAGLRQVLEKEHAMNTLTCELKPECLTAIWNKVIKRSIVTENNIQFHEKLGMYEDFEFLLKVLSHVSKVSLMPEAFYHYTIDKNISILTRRSWSVMSFIENITILKKTLDDYVRQAPLSRRGIEILYEILFRGYLYEIELAFIKKHSYTQRMAVIDGFLNNTDIRFCINISNPKGFRMKMIHSSMISGKKFLTYMIFSLKYYEYRLRYQALSQRPIS